MTPGSRRRWGMAYLWKREALLAQLAMADAIRSCRDTRASAAHTKVDCGARL